MKNRLQIIVAIRSVSISKTWRPVGHKLYGVFPHYVALAQDMCKAAVLRDVR